MARSDRHLPNAGLRALGLYAACSLVFSFGSALAYIWPIVALEDRIIVLGVLGLSLLVLSALFAWLAGRRGLRPATGLAAATASCGLGSTWVVLSGASGTALSALGIASVLLGSGMAVLCAKRARRPQARPAFLAAALALVPVATVAAAVLLMPQARAERAELLGRVPPAPVANPAPPPPVVFRTKPNVVLLGFLSAIPDSVAQAHLGLTATGLEEVLRNHGLIRVRNSFSAAVPTRRSYDALLNLGTPAADEDAATHPLSGSAGSAVFDIFRANGYRIETVTEDKKFGRAAGPFVDGMTIALAPSICLDPLLPENLRGLLFLGACALRDTRLYQAFGPDDDDLAAIYDRALSAALSGPTPTVVLGHFRPPYHYRGTKLAAPDLTATASFAERYAASTAVAARLMDRLLATVRARDPDAVIFVFGDMGLGLSDPPSDPPSEAPTEAPAPSFAVVDSFGVLAGLRYPDACPALQALTDAGDPVTTPEILARILGCLSGGAALPAAGGIALPQGRLDPRPFAYE